MKKYIVSLLILVLTSLPCLSVDFIRFVKDVVWNPPSRNATRLSRAVVEEDVRLVQRFIDSGIDVNSRCALSGTTPLVRAVSLGNAEIVHKLLQCPGIDPNIKGRNYHGLDTINKQQHPLEIAFYRIGVRQGYMPSNWYIVEELIKAEKTDVNNVLISENTLLHTLVSYNKLDLTKELLKKENIDVNANQPTTLTNGNTPLHIAISRRYMDIFYTLLNDARINVNKVNFLFNTPLCNAVLNYKEGLISYDILKEIVKKLSLHGANPFIKNKEGENLFDLISKINDEDKRTELKNIIYDYNKFYNFPRNIRSMFDQQVGFSKE